MRYALVALILLSAVGCKQVDKGQRFTSSRFLQSKKETKANRAMQDFRDVHQIQQAN